MLQTINGFQVLRKVAESNTAEIFHVLRLVGRGRGGEAAVKMLRPEFARDRVERGYLENEYRICSTLEHPNLIRVHEAQMSARQPFLVMDLITGPSLRTHMDRGRPNLAEALDWMAQVADGLTYFHELGYVHRDVKPQNCVISQEGTAVVIDFALAMVQDGSFVKYLMRRLTERRRPGTWSYMSPEQIRNGRVTASSDIYGMGVSLFEVATGRTPYAAATQQELLEKHVSGKIPSARDIRPELPLDLDDLIRAMMAKDPLDRPTGMGYVSGKLRSSIAACRKIL
jgi:serine/threonine-protein kinase